ncbi:uncharacterized protein METZ01_LOCUS1518 [marine metagenome]|uniref:Uncharacterized protein n=1 Tax=marine metagenome TaxID=408172 RepID=A0A381N3P4_9ZZZZ
MNTTTTAAGSSGGKPMAGTDRAVITSSKAPQPLGAYSMAMSVSPRKLIYIAGQVSVDSSGSLVGKGNVVAQTRQALKNIGHVLAAAGASFSDVVEFTTYVVGRPSVQGYIQGRSEVYPEMYPDSDFPPNTLLVVAGLVDEDFLVEIKAVAALH